MDSADQLLRLFAYDKWANEQVLITIQDHIPFDNSEESVRYFSHIAESQELWYRRITDQNTKEHKVWPEYDLAVALQKINTLYSNWLRLIDSNRSELDKIISYQNSKGTSYDTMLSDILHHVVIHGQHHRAQIAKVLRNAKIDPPATDFIFFSRTY